MFWSWANIAITRYLVLRNGIYLSAYQSNCTLRSKIFLNVEAGGRKDVSLFLALGYRPLGPAIVADHARGHGSRTSGPRWPLLTGLREPFWDAIINFFYLFPFV